MIQLKVIDGGKAELEEKILKDMFSGQVSSEDIDRLRPCGDLKLVASNGQPKSQRAVRSVTLPLDWIDDQTV